MFSQLENVHLFSYLINIYVFLWFLAVFVEILNINFGIIGGVKFQFLQYEIRVVIF